jgi:hypothetical protein
MGAPLNITGAPSDKTALNRWAQDTDSALRELAKKQAAVAQQVTTVTATAGVTQAQLELPPEPTINSVTQSLYFQDGSAFVVLTMTYTAPKPLGTFTGVVMGLQGYHGNTSIVLQGADNGYTGAAGGQQTFSVVVDRTGEAVSVFAIPVNSQKASPPWNESPQVGLTLNGALNTPAEPTGLTVTEEAAGNLITWNQVTDSNLGGYKLWFNTTSDFGTATLLHTFGVTPTTNSGNPSFFHNWVRNGAAYWYWVAALNTAGDAGTAAEYTNQIYTPPTITNLVPDSELRFPATYWASGAGTGNLGMYPGGSLVPGNNAFEGGTSGVNGWRGSGVKNASGVVTGIPVVPGNIYTFSARQNTLGATGNPAGWLLGEVTDAWGQAPANQGTVYVDLRQNNFNGRLSNSFTVPAGVTEVQAVFMTNGCTLGANGYNSVGGGCPMLEIGDVLTNYIPSSDDTTTGGIPQGMQIQSQSSGNLDLVIGDIHDRVNGSIGAAAENYLIAGGKVAWRALLGDTSGDTTTGFADAANKRFVHGAMSTPTQHDIGATAGTDGTYLNSGLLFGRHLSGAPSTDYGALADSSGYLLHGRMSTPTQAVINTSSQITSGTTLSASGTAMSTIDLSAVTGTQANLVPDSAMQFPNPYWPLAAGMSIGYGGGFGTGNTLVMNCTTPTTIAQPVSFPVNPGLPITLSANISASNMTAGYALIGLDWSGRGGTVYELDVAARAAAGRYSKTFTVPAGVSVMNIYYGQWASSGNPAGTAYINQIQVEMGSAMTAYRANALDALTAGLQHGLQVQEPGGILSPVLLGDAHARVRATIGGYSETGLDNVVDGSTYVRPQGVSSGHQLTYHGLYGDTSGDTTTAIVDGANKRFVHGAMSTATQDVINTSSQVTAATEIAGVTETPLTMQVLHDRVSATIGGYGSSGLANVPDGGGYAKTYAAVLQGNAIPNAFGKNLVPNPGFEINSGPTYWPSAALGQFIVDNWHVGEIDSVAFQARARGGYNQFSGIVDLEILNVLGASLSANTTYSCRVFSAPINTRGAEEHLVLTGWRTLTQGTAPPAGVTLQQRLGVNFYNTNNVQVGESYPSDFTSPIGWTNVFYGVTAPSGTAYAVIECCTFIVVGSTGVTTDATNPWIDAFFDDIALVSAVDYANEILDGQTDANGLEWNRLTKVASDNTLHASTSLNNQGSITGSSAGGIFSYTTTTTSITVTWVAGTIYLPDGSSISVPANSTGVTFSGLTDGSTYYIEAYWNMATSAVVVQNNGTGAASRQYLIQTLYGDQHIPLAQDWAITTSSSGGGSGGGGGVGVTCPADEQVIETLERGHIPAAQVMAAMHVRGADGGWKRVTAAHSEPGMILSYRIGGEDISVDVDHNWLRPGGNYLRPTEDLAHWTPTRLLHLGSQVQGVSGPLTVEHIGKARPGSYRKITVEPGPDGDRTFRAGSAIVHNMSPTT